MKPHKHADLIKQWADGAEIQFRIYPGDWIDAEDPRWCDNVEYRVKPKPKESWCVVWRYHAPTFFVQKPSLSEYHSTTPIICVLKITDGVKEIVND